MEPSAMVVGCERAALRVGRICHRLYQVASKATHMMSKHDWHQHCLAAVCLTYAEQGGTPETADGFDWEAADFIWAASRRLQADVVGKCSDYADIHRRNQCRSNGATTDELRWDAWRNPHSELPHNSFTYHPASGQPTAPQRLTAEYFQGDDPLADDVDRRRIFSQLLVDLERILQPREYRWLVERYIDGKDQYEMADALVAVTPAYQKTGGRAKAINLINVTVHRAKAKAQKLLSPEYRLFVAEVA